MRAPQLSGLWGSSYFRGVVSGLGIMNIYIAVSEAVKQMKSAFAR